jgi:hypothetical protein
MFCFQRQVYLLKNIVKCFVFSGIQQSVVVLEDAWPGGKVTDSQAWSTMPTDPSRFK